MFPTQPNRPVPQYNPDAPFQPIQIIVFALMMGVLVFAGVAIFLKFNKPNPNPADDDILPKIAAGLAVVMVVLRFIVPSIVANQQLKSLRSTIGTDDKVGLRNDIYGAYQTRTILEAAMLEGPCFLLLIAFIVTGQWWLLGVVAALLALMAAWFPTKGGIEHFIHEQSQQLEFEGEQ